MRYAASYRSAPGRRSTGRPPVAARMVAFGQLAARQRIQLAAQELLLERRQPVGEQHAIQMVRLVLDRTGQKALDHAVDRPAMLVEPAQAHRQRALDILG